MRRNARQDSLPLGCSQESRQDPAWGAGISTTQDGRKLFFPWAAAAGYVIASEHDYQRLQQQIKLYNRVYLTVAIALAIGVEWFTTISSIIAAFLSDMVYKAWMRRLLPRLKVSDEKLTHREWWSGTLKALKPIGPWTVQDPSVTSPRTVAE
ncbi:hypothetical protein [Bradyrhizobium sp. 199]|uniref:hypothetical protein n=1 Tax=Bradyrhizobium sp. 199 TaxID=2782664 RepID=UPI001FFAB926|nr:hypothetical protein [Bradyrhizobium sp. 199]MCK1360254.1 hypothetical protein [Bradyrhizobium sp. 199]